MSSELRQNLAQLTPLCKGTAMVIKLGLLVVHGNDFGQMPFLLLPMTLMGTSGS